MNYSFEAENADIDDLFGWIEQQLGPSWVSNSKNKAHPLKSALRVHHHPNEHRDMFLSQDIPRTLAFAKAIRTLVKFPIRRRNGIITSDQFFYNQLINRAKQSAAEFDATEIEAMVAWAYASVLEQPIIALEAGEDPTPDFEVTVEGIPTFIECKARNILTPLYRRIDSARSEIVSRVGSLLSRSPVNYGICISTTKDPNRNEIPELIKTIRSLLPLGRAFLRSIGTFTVEAVILLPSDEEITTPTLEPLGKAAHVPEPVRGFMIRSGVSNPVTYAGVHYDYQMRQANNLIYFKNPKVVIVHMAITPNHVKAVTELIRSARKQLPRNAPGIIVLRAPDFYGSDQFFHLGQGISRALSLTSRVSGVVLWHQAIQNENISPNEWDQTLRWQLFCIRNQNARNPLPPNFELKYLPRGHGFQVMNRP